MREDVHPFTVAIPRAALDDLKFRLAQTRWPSPETVGGWRQGVPLAIAGALADHWCKDYDWRRCEGMLNRFPQFTTAIDGLDIHFLHVRSPHPDALPLILTHGWPGSVLEFLSVIGPLTDPGAFGTPGAMAFHVIVPSLPGYGFSGKPSESGWGIARIASAWVTLMRRLGYARFVAQGGDWGAMVTTAIAASGTPECIGIHLTMALVPPAIDPGEDPNEQERRALADMAAFRAEDSGYAKLMGSRPQTIGYGLADSPVGLMAWMVEKLHGWADNRDAPAGTLDRDTLLDLVTLYWLTNSGGSASQLYWESGDSVMPRGIDLPVGVSLFPREIYRPSRRWAERCFSQLVYWNEPPRGGHFAALEQPGLFVDELRNCFSLIGFQPGDQPPPTTIT